MWGALGFQSPQPLMGPQALSSPTWAQGPGQVHPEGANQLCGTVVLFMDAMAH